MFTWRSGDIVSVVREMPPWQRLVMPALGGLLAGVCLQLTRRLIKGKRSTDYLEAISLGDGRLPLRISLGKAASAALSVGSGGSIGREGALVQLAALAASRMGVLVHMSSPRLRVLVAAGTAGGVAAAYHAPIAGSLFVAEVVLGSLAMESFGPLVVAAVAATLTARFLGEAAPLYLTKSLGLVSWWEVVVMVLLGCLAGFAARVCSTVFHQSEVLFSKIPVPLPARLALGGLLVGLIAMVHPEVCGNGQRVINEILEGNWLGWGLVSLLALKLIATSLTSGSGAVGGVLTPTLFLGAATGGLVGQVINALEPGVTAPSTAYALVGMSALLAAMTRAPLVSIVLVFELTLDYDLMAPAMLAAVSAYATASALGVESIYAGSLRNKREGQPTPPPEALRVSDLAKPPSPTIAAAATLAEIAEIFLRTRRMNLVVITPDGAVVGLVNLHDIKEYLTDTGIGQLVTAEELARVTPVVAPETTLDSTLQIFARFEGEHLPVVESESTKYLVGSISKLDVLLALAQKSDL